MNVAVSKSGRRWLWLTFWVLVVFLYAPLVILLVFSFLIVPAVITGLFATRLVRRLVFGWGVAIAASALGLFASWTWDLPTGAAIVTAFGTLLALAALARVATRRSAA